MKTRHHKQKQNSAHIELKDPREGQGHQTSNLDVNKYILGNNKNYVYDLYGCCNHIGTLDFGHYISNINYNNNWYKFDDSNVEKINPSSLISSNAYCLFYKKKTS